MSFSLTVKGVKTRKKFVVKQNFTGKPGWRKVLGRFYCICQYVFILSCRKVDVIYFTCSRSKMGSLTDIVLLYLARFARIPIINHIHGDDFNDLLNAGGRIFSFLIKNAYSYSKITFIVLLEGMKQKIKLPDNKLRIEVVPNCYDPVLDEKQDGMADVRERKHVRFLFLSNLLYSKGILQVVQAFKVLQGKYENIELDIAGAILEDDFVDADSMKIMFEKETANLANVRYHGVVYGSDKIRLLEDADIFVLPSYYKMEAFPISILEAFRMGCAVITTKHNYLPEIVTDDNGILVAPKCVDDLVSAMAYLIENNNVLRAFQNNNIKFVQDKYSYAKYISHIEKILAAL